MSMKGFSRNLLTDELYEYLKAHILSQQLPPGEKLNVDKLARELEVSRVPLREVLARLAAEGLVQAVPFKGMFVAEMNLRDIREIFEIRMELETLALRTAYAKIPLAQLQEIRSKKPAETTPFDTIKQMNEDLHFTLLHYADNDRLQRLVRSYLDQVHRYLHDVDYDSNVAADREEHQLILDKLVERDLPGAEEALRRHLRLSLERIIENLNNGGIL